MEEDKYSETQVKKYGNNEEIEYTSLGPPLNKNSNQ